MGDAVLTTALIEELKVHYPQAQLDYLIYEDHSSLFAGNPKIRRLICIPSRDMTFRKIWKLIQKIRSEKYQMVLTTNNNRFTGLLTALSGAKNKIGFTENPLSGFFTKKVSREKGIHEVERKLKLIDRKGGSGDGMPRLYPNQSDFQEVSQYQHSPYITLAPASDWYTKQLPMENWLSFLDSIDYPMTVLLIGAARNFALCAEIEAACSNQWITFVNLCGSVSLLQSAALMKGAKMNYCNDSGPMHIASAMDAPVRAVFCSTVEEQGFGPLSRDAKIIQTSEKLDCRPCNAKANEFCPLGHFKCATSISFNFKASLVKN